MQVCPSAVSKALRRHPAPAHPAQPELKVGYPDQTPPPEDDEEGCPDGAHDAASTAGVDTVDDHTDTDTEEIVEDTAGRVDQVAPQGETVAGASATALRITRGVFPTRYAGAMLAYAYLDRIGAGTVLTELPQTPWRRFDPAQIACHTLLALLLGVGSIEQVKTLPRAQAGPLTGTPASPELHTLRPRLTAIADQADVLAIQRTLAAAMLTLAGESAGIFYVDDHFVPYSGAKPVAMGHNGKRGRCEKGRADTLITNARGLAVCFTTGDPTHLSKTMQSALDELRQIIPTGKIMLGFDRGGAYAEAFTACQQRGIDFITYRRGTLTDHTHQPHTHTVTRGRDHITVHLADELIDFPGYTGPCRQLTLFEPGPTGDLTPVLQILTSDLHASALDLLPSKADGSSKTPSNTSVSTASTG